MDRNWTPLSPTKRHSQIDKLSEALDGASHSHSRHANQSQLDPKLDPFAIGRLPSAVIQRILDHVPVTDLPKCALAGRALARFVADERLWARRLKALQWKDIDGLPLAYSPDLSSAPDRNDRSQPSQKTSPLSPIKEAKQPLASNDDDFGDFEQATIEDDPFGGFVSSPNAVSSGQSFSAAPVFSYSAESSLPVPSAEPHSSYQTFKRIAVTLAPFISSLVAEPSPTSSLIFSHASTSSLRSQARLVRNIARFISPGVLGFLPSHENKFESSSTKDAELVVQGERHILFQNLLASVRESADYLEGVLLSAFEGADARRSDAVKAGQRGMDVAKSVERSEEAMQDHAHQVWDLAQAVQLNAPERSSLVDVLTDSNFLSLNGTGSAAAVSFLEKRDVLFHKVPHDPESNIRLEDARPSLDFTPMDNFMNQVLDAVKDDGSLMARVFPPDQGVLLAFASKLANELVADYINSVLRKARSISVHLYLQSCAATFAQALRLVDALLSVEPKSALVTRDQCENIIFTMWEANLDEYLQEERDWVKDIMAQTCDADVKGATAETNMDAAFRNAENPVALKRTVVTGFKDILLMPVTVVPRTAGIVGGAVIRTAGSGLSQLNPLRWQNQASSSKGIAGSSSPSGMSRSATPSIGDSGYIDFSKGVADDHHKNGLDEDDPTDEKQEQSRLSIDGDQWSADMGAWGDASRGKMSQPAKAPELAKDAPRDQPPSSKMTTDPTKSHKGSSSRFSRMQLLLSLDLALQLIQLNRESLRRMETFLKYPGSFGVRVKEEMEEIAVSFFQCLSEKHVGPGFAKASDQINTWNPLKQDQDADSHVAPLVSFFELVHVGDTIQQMVQVYYDQELSRHIDRTDFLNGVVREKKRFEASLDENVASGLNVGVDLLMGQAEHLISSHQDPRDYYPEPGADLDLANPTRACSECISCLKVHCRMLVGSTDKSVLEVFYQEVGIRLHAIICKHLKRQIISLDGGFKVIADLNAYHAFISSLRQANITLYFDALKMLGNLYIIDNPKELAAIVRDANMFNGTLSPEDLYEFLQARCDFKAIEKAIDKEMYGFKATEDCTVM